MVTDGLTGALLRDLAWAITDDSGVRDFLHGCLIGDNGWCSGYQAHFGLPGVGRATQRRSAGPRAAGHGGIAWAKGIA